MRLGALKVRFLLPLQCSNGGTGRRGRFKTCCPKGRVGSSPTLNTKLMEVWQSLVYCARLLNAWGLKAPGSSNLSTSANISVAELVVAMGLSPIELAREGSSPSRNTKIEGVWLDEGRLLKSCNMCLHVLGVRVPSPHQNLPL